MAKCPICNARKGKRQCLLNDNFVCGLCCGTTRKAESCGECRYYQKPKRRYKDVPAYCVSEMDGNMELERYGNAIEGALCAYDVKNGERLRDSDAIGIIEGLIDLHYFGDRQVDSDRQLILGGVDYIEEVIKKDLSGVNHEVIVKILGVIRFVAKRRTKIGREYMNVIHQYVGTRIDTGARLMRM